MVPKAPKVDFVPVLSSAVVRVFVFSLLVLVTISDSHVPVLAVLAAVGFVLAAILAGLSLIWFGTSRRLAYGLIGAAVGLIPGAVVRLLLIGLPLAGSDAVPEELLPDTAPFLTA